MQKTVPNLSTRGFITGIADQVDMLLSYVILANYSQTELYYSKITSMAYLVKQFGHDPSLLTDEMKTSLTRLFDRYFEGVIVNVDYTYLNEAEAAGPYKITMTLLLVNSEGQRINIASDLEITDGTFKEIARRNNEEPV